MLRRVAAASAGTLSLAYVALRPSHARQHEEDPPEPCADVLVIGGGIVGAAVAFQAAQQLGSRVTLLERESCGCEASGLSAGTMWCAGPPAKVIKQNAIWHLRYGSTTLLEAIGGCEFERCGGLDVAVDEAEARWLRADFEASKALGASIEWLEGADAICRVEPALAGGGALAAVHTPHTAIVQPALATRALVAGASAAGCHVIEGAEVASVRKGEGGVWVATTADGARHVAKHVVLAAGVGAPALVKPLGIQLPVTPVKGVIVTTPAPPGTLRKAIFDISGRLFSATKGDGRDDAMGMPANCTHGRSGERRCRKLYGKQCGASEGHQLLFGGERLPAFTDGYEVPEDSIRTIRSHTAELLPRASLAADAAGADAQGSWAGVMPFSPDMLPMVGECAELGHARLWLACGFGPMGIAVGPMAGVMLAEQVVAAVEGAPPADEGSLSSIVMSAMDPCRPGCCVRSPNKQPSPGQRLLRSWTSG